MQHQDVTKFEFVLTLEKNIVIQRFFNVNDYNPASKNSMNLYEVITEICEEISNDLKGKTLDYLNDNAEYMSDSERETEAGEMTEEYFNLQIKLGNRLFISRIFPAHIYHPKVRYAVDIRPKVRRILGDITNVLSSKDLNKSYLEYELR